MRDDEFDVRETYAAQEAALANIWDDPELDVYNDYEAQSSCRTTAGTSDRTVPAFDAIDRNSES